MKDDTRGERRTDEPDDGSEDGATASRRRVLQVAGATGLIGGMSGLGFARSQDRPVEIRLGGEIEGWTLLGDFQADFLGEGPNPTLNLEAGRRYEVFWRNLDGLPHNFAIINSNDDYVVRSEIISGQGATQTVRFTAQEGMAEYLCEVHPNSMRGDVRLGGQAAETTEAAPEPAGFFEEGTRVGAQVVAEGMTAPTDFAVANTNDDRRFVADQTGQVWVVTDDGRREEPFIDISGRMVELGRFFGDYADAQQDYDERGLIGIEFHPDFRNNRRFYLHYSAPPDGVDRDLPQENWDHWEILSEFRASEDLSRGLPDSERRLLEIASPQYNHDSGPFAFGPDGYLYFPMGDGGGANDDMYGHVPDWYERNAGGNGQDIFDNLLGSVLRIDVDGREGGKPYAIPDDNPFVGTQALPEIYAYGFRNPFGVSFDSRGNFFLADAGQNLWEEANIVEKGGNYGWNVKEGTHCFSTENAADPTAITNCPETAPQRAPYNGAPLLDPIVEYPHTYQNQSVGITIIGGHRYEQSTIGGLQGKYVFGTWTQDPARRQPMGRVFTAEPPADFDGRAGGTETAQATETRATTGSAGMGAGAQETTTATETGTGTERATTEGGTDAERVPRDQLWDMAELVFSGTENGKLPYFVRMFGRDADGEIYVLVGKNGIPQGNEGAVLKIVPPDQGDDLTRQATTGGTTRATETGTAETQRTTEGTGATETGTTGTGTGG